MAKVILITSREFDIHKDNGNRVRYYSDYAKIFIAGDDCGISSYLHKEDGFLQWFKKDNDNTMIMVSEKEPKNPINEEDIGQLKAQINIIIKQICPNLSRGNGNVPVNNDFIKFFDEMAKHIKNVKKSMDSSFHPGVFKISNDKDIYVYLAEEYPYFQDEEGIFTTAKQEYLDAIIGMVKADINKNKNKNEKKTIDEFIILSHDADWGKSTETIILKDSLTTIIKDKMPNLKEMTDKVTIICFQHDDHSKTYNTINKNIKDAKKLYNEINGIEQNAENFTNYLNNIDNCDVNFQMPFIEEVSCPDCFTINELS